MRKELYGTMAIDNCFVQIGKEREKGRKKEKKRKNSLLPWNLLHGAWKKKNGHGDSRSKYIL